MVAGLAHPVPKSLCTAGWKGTFRQHQRAGAELCSKPPKTLLFRFHLKLLLFLGALAVKAAEAVPPQGLLFLLGARPGV